MIHFTSDTHFGHANVIIHGYRPFKTVEEMDATLVNEWNRVVKPEDTVWHLGDFAWFKESFILEVLASLNGVKHLVLGNHDRLIEKRPTRFIGEKAFASIQSYRELKMGKTSEEFLVLNHYAQRVWNKSHYGTFHLHGHSHGNLEPFGRSLDVGVDCKLITPEYRPVSLEEVRHYMRDRVTPTVDHHAWVGSV
jgi:calcineurin-like phosphoesterase family protein